MKKFIFILAIISTFNSFAQDQSFRFYGKSPEYVMSQFISLGQELLYKESKVLDSHLIFSSPVSDYIKIGYRFSNNECTSIEYYYNSSRSKIMKYTLAENYNKVWYQKWEDEGEKISIRKTKESKSLSYVLYCIK